MKPLRVVDAGLSDYQATREAQLEIVKARRERRLEEDHLIFVEHPEVYTYGRKSGAVLPIHTGVPHIEVERGGEATYHNPGQLVAYPIIYLEPESRDLHKYLRSLEQVVIDVLGDYGIASDRKAGATGVWVEVGSKKIASIGIAVSGWVTYHGVALNVENRLEGFATINPCGFDASVMTSMRTILGESCPSLEHVKSSFLARFLSRFDRKLSDQIGQVAQAS